MKNIENKYIGYENIVDEFTAEVVESKYKVIYQELADFLKSGDFETCVRIEDTNLMHMVMDYFSDVSRLKRFHGIKVINETKVISYESYWLLRRKPLQVVKNETGNDTISFVNEKFVFSRLAKFLAGPQLTSSLTLEKRRSLMNYFDTLYYYLKYRMYDAQVLELMILGFIAGQTIGK